jgi:small subunit ribosomal protein S16
MVKIRLARGGAKKRPFYSIVVTDSRKRRDSAYIERIGYFNPVARGQEVRLTLEEDRLTFWQSKGAQLTDRVSQLVKEFKDPSIREKQLAAKAAKIEAIKAKAEAEAKAAAEAAAAEEAAAAAEEAAAAEAEATTEEAETPAEEAAPEAEAEAKEE